MSAIAFMGLFSVADYLVSGGLITPLRRKGNDRKRIDPGPNPRRMVRNKNGGAGKVR